MLRPAYPARPALTLVRRLALLLLTSALSLSIALPPALATLPSADQDHEIALTPTQKHHEVGELYINQGHPADPARTPWVAYVLVTNWNNTGATCTGSLIDPSWVITARHCVANNPRYVTVAMGANRLGRYAVDNAVKSETHDVALLHLATAVPGVAPIPIAGQPSTPGTSGLQYGWGGSYTVLQQSEQTIVEKCVSQVSLTSTQFTSTCGGNETGPESYKTSYQGGINESGDSGGPLVINDQLAGTLIGGNESGSFFVVLPPLAQWIKDVTGVVAGKASAGLQEYPYESRIPRIAGQDRVDTALALFAKAQYAGDSIVLATGLLAPDALGASALAGAAKAPILLSNTSPVEPRVVQAILDSGKKQLYVVGGKVTFSPEQETQLEQAGIKVTKLAGIDRYDTVRQVAQASREIVAQTSAPEEPNAGSNAEGIPAAPNPKDLDIFLVDGASDPNIPDALSVGAVAAQRRAVILFTRRGIIPDQILETISQLAGATKAQQGKVTLYAVGGMAVAGAQSAGLTQEGAAFAIDEIIPLAGGDRYLTNTLVLRHFGPADRPYLVASGTVFADGLAAAGYAVPTGSGIILTRPESLPPNTVSFIREHGKSPYTIVGGAVAVSRLVANNVGSLLTR